MDAILALDQGTTSSRAIVFDAKGAVLAIAQREFRQSYPQAGWVEHDASEIWSTQIAVAAEALARAPQATIAGIGITNQRETTVVWNGATGEPIAPAIVWQDRRTADFCEELRAAGHEELIRSRTGLLPDPYFSGTKLRWLLEHVDGARAQAESGQLLFGTIDSWLIWKLTGGAAHVTDVSNASRTLLYDIHRGVWDEELLVLQRVPPAMLPRVVASSGVCATTSDGLPIPSGIPIAGIAGDQQAALFGQRCTRAGMAKNTYGTGSFVVMNTGLTAVRSAHGLLSTIAWRVGGETAYALEGSIFVTGAAVQWLRDELRLFSKAAEIEPLAASVPDSQGVIVVPAFTGLGAPHWDPHARGAILGLTRGSTGAHIARATLEAIALQTAEVLEAMEQDSGIALEELRVDGGGSTNDLLLQLQADVTGIPVVRTRMAETTALGAAYLAGLATGFWSGSESIDAQWRSDRTFEPQMSAGQRAETMARWRAAVRMIRG